MGNNGTARPQGLLAAPGALMSGIVLPGIVLPGIVLAGALAAPSALAETDRTGDMDPLGGPAYVAYQTAAAPGVAPEAAPESVSDTEFVQLADREKAFDIPAQPLTSALTAFGRQAGLQITVDGALARGIQAPAISGSMAPEEALKRLLAGTGLTYRVAGGSTVAVERAGGDGTMLEPIRVEGKGMPEQAQLGNLPQPYAGGQVARGGKLGVLGNRDIMDTPFNQTNYTSKLMKDQQVQYIADSVRNDPSVIVGTPVSSGVTGFTIRGFNVSNVDMTFNGMPNVIPSFGTSMTSEWAERVEVLKGASGLINGITPGRSVGGAVNLVPKRAGSEPLTQFTPDYTSNAKLGGHIDVGRRYGAKKEFGVRFNGVYRDGDTPIDNQSQQTALAALALDYQGDDFRLEADLNYQLIDIESQRAYFLMGNGVAVPETPDTTSNVNAPWEYTRNESYFGALQGEFDVTRNITAFASIGGYERFQKRTVNQNRTITNANGDLSANNATLRSGINKGISTEVGVRGDFTTGAVEHEPVAAYAFSQRIWEEVRANYGVVASNIYAPVYSAAPNTGDLSFEEAKKMLDQDMDSITLADTMSLYDDRVQVTLGGRYQRIDVTNYSRITGNFTSGFEDDALTPMAAVLVKPRKDVSVYASYIEGLQEGATAPSGTTNAGEVFAPYVTEQYEAGVKWDTGTFGSTVSAYQISLPDGYTNTATNTFVVDGIQRHRGLEWNVFGEIARGLRLLGGVSFVDSELQDTNGGTNDGNRGVGVPKFRTVLGVDWDTPFMRGLSLSGRATYQSAVYLNAANTTEADGWTRVDIGARYTIERADAKPIVIRAGIDNLFDNGYWNITTAGQMNVSDPRTFKLSTTFEF